MKPPTTLDIVALTLAAKHFGVTLTYYFYLKNRYLNKSWNIKVDENYRPRVTIIVPTYNEAKLIQRKLDNTHNQDYIKNLVEVINTDSANTDKTAKLTEDGLGQPEITKVKELLTKVALPKKVSGEIIGRYEESTPRRCLGKAKAGV
ncbi:MAG: hypothetical protein DRO13_06015 [Thermoprotei archaeon]|nr:MAG: hypothetical protein DRO13_06015 [Thermoprotei archaeon]